VAAPSAAPPPPFHCPAADSLLGELLVDVLSIACGVGYAIDLQRMRALCGTTFRLGARRADGSLDTRGFAGGTADMIASSLRLQAPWIAAARASQRVYPAFPSSSAAAAAPSELKVAAARWLHRRATSELRAARKRKEWEELARECAIADSRRASLQAALQTAQERLIAARRALIVASRTKRDEAAADFLDAERNLAAADEALRAADGVPPSTSDEQGGACEEFDDNVYCGSGGGSTSDNDDLSDDDNDSDDIDGVNGGGHINPDPGGNCVCGEPGPCAFRLPADAYRDQQDGSPAQAIARAFGGRDFCSLECYEHISAVHASRIAAATPAERASALARKIERDEYNYPRSTHLSRAVRCGDERGVRLLLAAGAPVDGMGADDMGRTPLAWACCFPYTTGLTRADIAVRLRAAEALLDFGANVAAADDNCVVPLAHAVMVRLNDETPRACTLPLVRLLLERGAVIPADRPSKYKPPLLDHVLFLAEERWYEGRFDVALLALLARASSATVFAAALAACDALSTRRPLSTVLHRLVATGKGERAAKALRALMPDAFDAALSVRDMRGRTPLALSIELRRCPEFCALMARRAVGAGSVEDARMLEWYSAGWSDEGHEPPSGETTEHNPALTMCNMEFGFDGWGDDVWDTLNPACEDCGEARHRRPHDCPVLAEEAERAQGDGLLRLAKGKWGGGLRGGGRRGQALG
jgi:ankyrin repeat protein